MPFLAVPLMVVSTLTAVASAGISIAQGAEQKKAMNKAARMEEDAANTEAALKRSQLAAVQGAVRANFASRGADADTGSAFSLQSANERAYQIDAGLGAKQRANNAFQFRSRGNSARAAGILSGIGSLASAAGTAAEGAMSYKAT